MDKCMWLQYPSSIEQIVERNESFDACVIKICYTGDNRNKSSISKQAIEDAIPSIYNCPIVCNYNVQEDTIGGHDVEVVSTNNGMRLINLTDAVGVIPCNCNYYWETISDNGVSHEYLCVEAILWKRSSAYNKIKRDGIVSQSMEITVKNGKSVDGVYEIDRFIFTAFCLLGEDVEPCFESASLETFSLQQYKSKFEEMMLEFKNKFSKVNTSQEDDIYMQKNKQNLSKGGKISLDRMNLLSEYGLTVDALDFNIEDFSIDELREKFESIKKKKTMPGDDDDVVSVENNEDASDENTDNNEEAVNEGSTTGGEGTIDENGEDGTEDNDANDENENPDENNLDEQENYSLTGEQFATQLQESLSAVKFMHPEWGEMYKYMYVDYEYESSEVYCYDCEDWRLYGFPFSINGDNVVVDFGCKKRKKFSIVDFDEGSSDFNYGFAFDLFGKSIIASKDAEMVRIKNESDDLRSEISVLKEYQNSKLAEERRNSEEELFARFSELNGIEAFEALRSACTEMSLEDIESKCFEIKGRNVTANFSSDKPKSTRIKIEKTYEKEPYGGLFIKFPPNKN